MILKAIRYFTFCSVFSGKRGERGTGRQGNGAIILPRGDYGCSALEKFLFRYKEVSDWAESLFSTSTVSRSFENCLVT